MELPRFKGSGGGMLDGLKSKLGFAEPEPQDDYDEPYYDDYDQGYEDYDDYGQDDDGYGSRPSGRGSSRSSAGSGSGPHLVSIDDVRANTQIPDSLSRDPLPPRHVSAPSRSSSTARSGYRPYSSPGRAIEHAADYMRSTETSDVTTVPAAPRSSGYDSLFSSTPSASSQPSSVSSSARSYDPYETYSGSGISSHNPSRSLTVLKPASYGEVERVAKTLKAGDVVVLSLRNTPDQLAKRILDFSFGVSSALDASVECIADKVFVIIRGRELTEEERMNLRNQGVL